MEEEVAKRSGEAVFLLWLQYKTITNKMSALPIRTLALLRFHNPTQIGMTVPLYSEQYICLVLDSQIKIISATFVRTKDKETLYST